MRVENVKFLSALKVCCFSVAQVVSDFLLSQGLQHASVPYPSPSP